MELYTHNTEQEINNKMQLIEELIKDTENKISDLDKKKDNKKESLNNLKKDIKKIENNKYFYKNKRDLKLKEIIADLVISSIEENKNTNELIFKISSIITKYNLKISASKKEKIEQEHFEQLPEEEFSL